MGEEKIKMQEEMKEKKSRRAGRRRMEGGEEIGKMGGEKAEESRGRGRRGEKVRAGGA